MSSATARSPRRRHERSTTVAVEREAVLCAIARLTLAERARLRAVEELQVLQDIEAGDLVSGIGSAIAAVFYGVDLPSKGTSTLDTCDGRRVLVRTLHTTGKTPPRRLGAPFPTHDILFAIRLDKDYSPLEAIEVPHEVVADRDDDPSLSWTRQLTRDPRVRHIPGHAL